MAFMLMSAAKAFSLLPNISVIETLTSSKASLGVGIGILVVFLGLWKGIRRRRYKKTDVAHQDASVIKKRLGFTAMDALERDPLFIATQRRVNKSLYTLLKLFTEESGGELGLQDSDLVKDNKVPIYIQIKLIAERLPDQDPQFAVTEDFRSIFITFNGRSDETIALKHLNEDKTWAIEEDNAFSFHEKRFKIDIEKLLTALPLLDAQDGYVVSPPSVKIRPVWGGRGILTGLIMLPLILAAFHPSGLFAQTVQAPIDSSSVGSQAPSPGITSTKPSLNAWLANFHIGSGLRAFKDYAQKLQELSIFGVSGDKKGHLSPNHAYIDALLSELKTMERRPRILMTVTNDRPRRMKDHRLLVQWIGNAKKRQQHIQDLLLLSQRFDGLDIDYENLKTSDGPLFQQFIQELGAALHARGKYLTVTIEIKTLKNQAINWSVISQNVDRVRVMAYQYHFGKTAPGSVSPPDEVLLLADFALGRIPSEKLEIALPIYGFDWVVDSFGRRRGRGKLVGTVDKFQYLSGQLNAETFRDSRTHAARIDYDMWAGSGQHKRVVKHQVFYEDPPSIAYKINALSKKGIVHIGLWQLGVGDLSELFDERKSGLNGTPVPVEIQPLPTNTNPDPAKEDTKPNPAAQKEKSLKGAACSLLKFGPTCPIISSV